MHMLKHEPEELSEREREILRLVATGASNKEIAQQLFISPNTVKVHLRNIFAKIGVASRTEAAMYAVRIGLVETESRSVVDENDMQSTYQAQSFPQPTRIIPDTIKTPSRFKSPLLWVFAIGLLIITIPIVVLGVGRLRNINPETTITPPPITATPIQQWFSLADLPTPRSGLATVGYEGKIYAIAGENDNGPTGVVERYDTETDSWVTLAPKPMHVTDISAAVLGGLIYLPGGRLASGQPTKRLEIYDPQHNAWNTGADLPYPISAYAMVAFEGKLFLFGGWDGQQYLDTVLIYVPDRDTWVEGPIMPQRRAFAGAVATNNKIYIMGGTDGEQALTANDIFQPGLLSQPWSKGTPLPGGRYGMGVTNIADIFHLFGGHGSEPSSPGLAYFAQQDEWRQIETPLKPGYSSMGIATSGTRLYLLGGTTNKELNSKTWSYQAIFIISLPLVR